MKKYELKYQHSAWIIYDLTNNIQIISCRTLESALYELTIWNNKPISLLIVEKDDKLVLDSTIED